eukprot:TRINITY_DN4096_c0_g1_i2.p1 TRINITY_DN4096_c0_g1~~TRINITY_DN4096_c0_g1_i2.p1  ORF type:complete len:505 (-),score=129.63 TRINITY_DN4096_c0_g1_i2:401-1915(-)
MLQPTQASKKPSLLLGKNKAKPPEMAAAINAHNMMMLSQDGATKAKNKKMPLKAQTASESDLNAAVTAGHKPNRSAYYEDENSDDEMIPRKLDPLELLERPSAPVPPPFLFDLSGKPSGASELQPRDQISTASSTAAPPAGNKNVKLASTTSATPSSQLIRDPKLIGRLSIKPVSISPIADAPSEDEKKGAAGPAASESDLKKAQKVVTMTSTDDVSVDEDSKMESSTTRPSGTVMSSVRSVHRKSFLSRTLQTVKAKPAKELKVFILCVPREEAENSKSMVDDGMDDDDAHDYMVVEFHSVDISLDDIIDFIVSQYNNEGRKPAIIAKTKLYSLYNVDVDEEGIPDPSVRLEIEDFQDPKCLHIALCLADGVKQEDVLRAKAGSKDYPDIAPANTSGDKLFIRIIHPTGSNVVEVARSANLERLLTALSKKKKCALMKEQFAGFSSSIHPELYEWATKVGDLNTGTVTLHPIEQKTDVVVFNTECPDPSDFMFTLVSEIACLT